MEGQDIEKACVLATATSDVVILMDEIPQHTPDLRVPAEIFHAGNEFSKKPSLSDPTSFPEETERWSSLGKMTAVLLLCGILLCIIVSSVNFLYQVLPAETFVQLLSGSSVVVFVAIFFFTIFVRKGRKASLDVTGAAVNIDELLQKLHRDRL